MEIHDIHQLLVDEVNKLPGYKKMGGDHIMVCCPFHDDSSPSMGIYMAAGMELPLGAYHCFGCGAKGRWNTLAARAGLQQIKEWALADASALSVGNVSKILGAEKTWRSVKSMMKALDRQAYIEWPESEPWRGYEGKIIKDFGGLLLMDNFQAAYPVCFFPVSVARDKVVGGIAAYLKKQVNGLSYVNTKGDWVKETGLFQWQVARRMIRDHGLDYAVIVEGPRDTLGSMCRGLPTVGVLGAENVSVKKIERMKVSGVSTIFSIPDNDKGGDKLRANVRRCCQEAGIRHVPIRLPKEYDEKGNLIKLDPDSLPNDIWSDIVGFIRRDHDTVNVRSEYGWKKQKATK